MRQFTLLPFSFLLLAFAGCFNEPEPAYKSVPAESRLYLQDKGLKDLKTVDLSKVGDYLNLDRNQLTNVSEVAKLAGLKWLRLNDNRLTALPALTELKALRRIYLRNNQLTEVPASLEQLPALTDIDLSGNPLAAVPEWLAKKPGLKNLGFSRTRITALPKDLSAWQSLQTLQLGELQFSPEEMARVRKALPKTAITF